MWKIILIVNHETTKKFREVSVEIKNESGFSLNSLEIITNQLTHKLIEDWKNDKTNKPISKETTENHTTKL